MNFDLIIIGGGINGAGIARDAALRGLKVLLLDKGDFASGTSSRSTKLIHGGIRYLENFEFKLVWEACHERKILTKIASQLVHSMPFIIPSYKGDKRPLWLVRLGMFLYDVMAGFKNIHRHKRLSKSKIIKLIPKLKAENLQGGGVYYDCQTNDARLTLANLQDATQHGAVVKNYIKVVNVLAIPTQPTGLSVFCEDVLSGEKTLYSAPYIVNATGPWLDLNQNWDIFKNSEDEQTSNQKSAAQTENSQTPQKEQTVQEKPASKENKLRLTKGIHFFTNALTKEYAILVSSKQDNRVFFIIPWGEFSLVGTTDTDYKGNPDDVKVEKADLDYLINELKRLFPGQHFDHSHIFGEYAGLRPLLNMKGVKTGAVSREYHLEEIKKPQGTVLSVVGGKITTYRRLAQKVTDKIMMAKSTVNDRRVSLGKSCQTHEKALPGSQFAEKDFEEFVANTLKNTSELQNLDADIARNLIQTYGSEIPKLIPYLKEKAQLKKISPSKEKSTQAIESPATRIIPQEPFIWAQLNYAIDHEWVKTAQDFIWRRTELYLHLKKYPQLEELIQEKIQKFL